MLAMHVPSSGLSLTTQPMPEPLEVSLDMMIIKVTSYLTPPVGRIIAMVLLRCCNSISTCRGRWEKLFLFLISTLFGFKTNPNWIIYKLIYFVYSQNGGSGASTSPSPSAPSPPPTSSPPVTSNSPPWVSPPPPPTPSPAANSPSPSPPASPSPSYSSPPPVFYSSSPSPTPLPTLSPDPTWCLDELPPGASSTCQEIRSWGQCDTLQGVYCRVTCATCP